MEIEPNQNNQPQENQELSGKIKAKQLFSSYIEMMTNGCYRERCNNIYCAKNPYFFKKPVNEIAKECLLLLNKKNIELCVIKYNQDYIQSLQLKEIQQLFAEAQESQNYSNLIQRFKQVFSNSNALNLSFMINENACQFPTPENSFIDFDALNECSQKINSLQQDIKSTLISAIRLSIRELIKSKFINDILVPSLSENGDELRMFLIILEMPSILEFESIQEVIQLFEMVNSLPKWQKDKYFIPWFSQFEDQKFFDLISKLQQLISLKVLAQFYINLIIINLFLKSPSTKDWNYCIQNLVKFMKILWDTNLKTQKIAFEEFNNTLITQEIPALQEFVIWRTNLKKNKNNFTFCDYPFIMEIAFKAKILEEEMKYEQRKEQKSQLALNFNLILQNRVQSLISKTWVDLLTQSVDNQLSQQANPLNMEEEVSLTNGQLRIPHEKAWKALFFTLEVRREFLVEDALKQLQQANVNFKKELRVKFIGEEGYDQGGVRKEFFQLIVKQLFSTSYGMFVMKNNNRLLWINGCSSQMNLYFELVGNVLGLAIYNAINLDLHLPNIIYKKLLNEPYSIENLKEIEPEIYQSLKFIQDYKGNDLEDLLLQPFQIKINSYGEDSYIELKPNGSNIYVSNQNKQEFIDLYLDWFFNVSIKQQFESFAKGFNKVVHGDAIKFINSSELHTLICGSPILDFYELEQSTQYEEPFSSSHETVKDFWEIIHSLTEEEQKKFLFFATGSDRAPIEGLSQLNLVISRQSADSESLPTSHTCFNHLLIPEYANKQKLKEKLLLAINNSEGFGLI